MGQASWPKSSRKGIGVYTPTVRGFEVGSRVVMKTVRIFSNRNRDRNRGRIRLSVSESEYPTSDTVSVSEYLNCIFIISTFNRILCDMVEIIRIRIRSDQKYESKYDIMSRNE